MRSGACFFLARREASNEQSISGKGGGIIELQINDLKSVAGKPCSMMD
jgi:hypothetical protein